MTNVLGCWSVHLATYSVVVVLKLPANVCYVHIEAKLMPASVNKKGLDSQLSRSKAFLTAKCQ